MQMKQAINYLQRIGVRSMQDVDARKGCDSRFGWLKSQVGENAAHSLLHELAIIQCCQPPKRR